MKKIEAIIRVSRFEDVKKALYKAGIEWLSYWDMTSLGYSTRDQIVRGQVFHSNYLQRQMLCIVVRDENQDIAVDAIMAARTGERGDGNIVVSTIERAWSIRTGKTGPKALFNKES